MIRPNQLYPLLVLLFLTVTVKCSKILVIYHLPSFSHYNLGSTLAFELAARGHDVTFINPFPSNITRKNVREIPIENVKEAMTGHRAQLLEINKENAIGYTHFMSKFATILAEETLKNPNVQNLIKSGEKFDLVVHVLYINEAFTAFGQIFQAPIVGVTSMPPFPWDNFRLGHPTPPSYVPVLFSSFSNHMSFWERCLNSFYDFYAISYYNWYYLPKQREFVKKYFPNNLDLDKFMNDISLVLINSHSSVYDATPRVPNAIEIGGFHVKKPKPLPADLQEFMDKSTNGVILFSLGSNVKVSELDKKIVDSCVKSFSKLKQNVLWKWETDKTPAGASKNIKFMKWIPQNDVLGHPNTKAFITHGGLLSTTESIYHGVPLIGIPIFTDQKMNMAHASNMGYAILLHLNSITEKTLSKALDEVLNNPKYLETMKTRSKIMNDQPLKPLDSAVYWMEYVIRHKGAHHMKYGGMNLAWYQRNLIDVAAFFFLVLLIVFLLIRLIVKKLLGLLFGNKRKAKTQ